ncbi:MAG: TlpA family protein disulfide reductase [Gaiellaceae bacterium]
MRTRRRLLLALVALAVGASGIVLGGFVLARRDDTTPTAPESGTVRVDPPAPPLAGTDPITGARVALARVKRRPVVIHVWASWCRACANKAPVVREFVEKHRRRVVVLGLDLQDAPEAAKAFYARYRWTHRIISDPDGRQAARFGVRDLPSTIFLDQDHLMIARIEGPRDARRARGRARAGEAAEVGLQAVAYDARRPRGQEH